MKILSWIPGAALAAAALSGCHSAPPLHYYALDAVSPPATAVHADIPWLIHVRHVGVPHEIDHLGLTHHVGPTQLAISDGDQWTAPLSVLIQGTLTRDLGERLGYEHVVAVDALAVASHPAADSQTVLDLDFVSLSADDGCAVTAQVNWTLSGATGPARRGTVHLAAAASGCPAGLPAALSTALGDLADQLATRLTTP